MASVKLNHIKKVYGKDTLVVQDFNLEIADKEFLVLVGPSGCGKSTTLRMIAGLEDITDGELFIGDKCVNHVPAKDRDIAMVFQSYALYPHMTVYENMAFALKLRKVSKAEIDQQVRRAAEILDITQYLSRKPKALSGGQRQRVAIGRAIVRDPQVFLMDEPLSNLDAKLRNQMRAELILLRKRIDTTFVYVTHDQTEAMTLGDRIVVMKDGIVQQVGTPTEVFSHPINTFVAGFIGSPQMNLFRAEVLVKDGQYWLHVCDHDMLLSESKQKLMRDNHAEGMCVQLGIRPEDISLVKPEGTEFHAHILMSEMMGSEQHIHANIGTEVAVIRQQTSQLEDAGIAERMKHEDMGFFFNQERLHFFDCESGARLFD